MPRKGAVTPGSGKIVSVGKKAQSPEVANMAMEGRMLRAQGLRWRIICHRLKIYFEDGTPDTGLAYKIIVEGYEPKLQKTRTRLGFLPICPECHQRLPKPPRVVRFDPGQMDDVIAFLRSHESISGGQRVYVRNGKRVRA